VPIDEEFGIVIPKVRANSRIHADIDWQNPSVYQKALQTGVAQAKGTSTPDMPGSMFLFSHSGVDFYEAARYNAEFYLLGKLEAGDEIDIFYKGQKYLYTVRETKIVAPSEVEYLSGQTEAKTVTLMTCWPAGTTYKRLIVIADQKPL
jgi:sortase A